MTNDELEFICMNDPFLMEVANNFSEEMKGKPSIFEQGINQDVDTVLRHEIQANDETIKLVTLLDKLPWTEEQREEFLKLRSRRERDGS